MPNNKTSRLLALDVFRGLTIIFMIMVNSPNTYGEFSHAYWVGVNFADLVFPFFILIVGVAVGLGFKHAQSETFDKNTALKKAAKRTLILFALGLGVNLMYTHFAEVRILGVLQRIALVYFACCVLALYTSPRQWVKISLGLLIGYWLFVLLVPAPGLPVGHLERGQNIINWFDQFVPGMLWRGDWDPEGLLSTFPAIVSGVFGMLMARIIIRSNNLNNTVMYLFLLGFGSFSAGCVWSMGFPMIKQIWTSSFVLVTSGVGSMILAFLLWYTDIRAERRGTYIAQVFGANAITAYVLHVALEKLLDAKFFAGESIHGAYVSWSLNAGMSEFWSATLWIIGFIGLCLLPIWVMYKKRIFVKI